MSEYYLRWVFLILAILLFGLFARSSFFRKYVGRVQKVEDLPVKKTRIDNGMYLYDFETDGEKVKLLVYQGVAQQLELGNKCRCCK